MSATLARLAPSSPGAAPRSSAGVWRWMCSELGCSNVTGDTFTPGCLNQWGQPIPGGVEPRWDKPTLGGTGQLGQERRPGWSPGTDGRAVPGALLSHLLPAAAAGAKTTPAASPLMSSQDILLAGCAAQAQQKESPLRRCSLAFPWAGIQESLPTDWACRGPPRLCPHARFAPSLFGRLPAELGRALVTQGGVRPIAEQPHVLAVSLSLAAPFG